MEWVKKKDKSFPIGKKIMVRAETRSGEEYMEYVEVDVSRYGAPLLKVGNCFVDPDKVTDWMEIIPPARK